MTTDDHDAALARLRTDLALTRDVLAQTQRAVEAERAARVRAEGENVGLREETHELAAHVLRVLGEDERPSMAIRALVLRARAVREG